MAEKTIAASPRIMELTRRLEQDPGSRAFVELSKAYQASGELEEAARVCREGLEKQPGYHSARVLLGKLLLNQESFDEASGELQRVVSEAPDNLLARRLLGEAQEGGGRVSEALSTYEELVVLLPGDSDLEARVEALRSRGEEPADPSEESTEAPGPPLAPPVESSGVETLGLRQDVVDESERAPSATAPPGDKIPPTTAMESPMVLEAPGEGAGEPIDGGEIPATVALESPAEPAGPEPWSSPPSPPSPDGGSLPPAEAPGPIGNPDSAEALPPVVRRTAAMDPSELGLDSPDEDRPTETIDLNEMGVDGPPPADSIPETVAGSTESPEADAGTVMMQAPDLQGADQGEAGPDQEADSSAGADEEGALPTPTLAELYVEQGMPEKAIAVYRSLLAGDPDNTEIGERLKALTGAHEAPESPARRKIQALQGWLQRIKRNHDAQGSA